MRKRDENKIHSIRMKAIEMIVQRGFDGLSMQKLAQAAGVSPATIYIYFKDRDDLILNLCLQEYDEMIAATLKDFDPGMPFEEGLRIQWKNRASYWINNPLKAEFMEQIRHSPYHEKSRHLFNKGFTHIMHTFVHHAIKRKELVKTNVEVFWSVAYAPLYQLVKFHLSGKGLSGAENFVLTDQVMNQAFKLVLKALKP